MDRPIRVGIIGCGVIAPTHLQAFQALPGVEVRWLCDLVEDKARALAARYGVAHTCAEARHLLADPAVELVVICTGHAAHVPLVEAALAAGKHVLCEKALAADRPGLERLLAAHAAHPQLRFGAIFQHRHDAVNQTVKALLAEGAFGTLLTASATLHCWRSNEYYQADGWRGTWAGEGGSVLINQAIHFADLLQWLVGGVAAVCGGYANRTHAGVIETEDTVAAALRFRNGALGTLAATCSSHLGWEATLAFHGTAGSLELRNDQPVKLQFADAARQAQVAEWLAQGEPAAAQQQGKNYYGGGHPAQLADMVAAIREGRDPLVTAELAAETVKLVLAVYESQRVGGWVPVG